MPILDISRPLSSEIAVWPGDQPFDLSWTATQEEGYSVNLGAARMSLHTGTHADAPRHVRAGGTAIDALPLAPFIGPAVVIPIEASVQRIRPDHLCGWSDVMQPRVLFQTAYSHQPASEWSDAFAAIEPATIRWLAERDVVLVGTDAPSVDPADSTSLEAHHALVECGMVNLELLDLTGITPGVYQLIALPLRVHGMDASPVRAVLMDDD